MINRSLAKRLKQVEERLGPAQGFPAITVRFIEPGTMAVVSTLRIENGKQTWRHAAGHEAKDAQPTNFAGREGSQMGADEGR